MPAAAPLPRIEPMLATLARVLPVGDGWSYEPKWDGFRCLAARDGGDVDLRSRNGRPFSRYFPEVVDALRTLPSQRFVLDGELLACSDGRPDFASLMARLHPSTSRVELLRRETPAFLVAFDLVLDGDDDLRDVPFAMRRPRLEQLLATSSGGGCIQLNDVTGDPAVAARWLDAPAGEAIDGVVAKHADLRYEPGKRSMVKVKRQHTVDCVVAGFRRYAADGSISSLLLGLHDGDGTLRHVGVASPFAKPVRQRLLEELGPFTVPLDEHPWREGFALEGGAMGRLAGAAGRWQPGMPMDWVPVRPERVCEVGYDRVDGIRFRHPATFLRWRPDRDARSCTVDQLPAARRA